MLRSAKAAAVPGCVRAARVPEKLSLRHIIPTVTPLLVIARSAMVRDDAAYAMAEE